MLLLPDGVNCLGLTATYNLAQVQKNVLGFPIGCYLSAYLQPWFT